MISVVVPVLDEVESVERCLERLQRQQGDFEVIVVDGGSRDGTAERVGEGARLVRSPPGRGRQMNAGAAAGRGEILLFLHVDTELGPGSLDAVERALQAPEVVAGGFSKQYRSSSRWLRLVAGVQNQVRCRRLRHLVGTQALFVRRPVFEALGGYRDLPLLEDVELSDRLRRTGGIVLIGPSVVVSARRYLARGVLRQVLVNIATLALYRLGVTPGRLVRLYRGAAT